MLRRFSNARRFRVPSIGAHLCEKPSSNEGWQRLQWNIPARNYQRSVLVWLVWWVDESLDVELRHQHRFTSLSGGMQDFNYVFTNCFEITLELSCCKYPSKSELPTEWRKNKKSLIEYMKMSHMGIKGLVKDINGYPINDAEIFVQGVEDKPVRATERGEFWRLVTPGTYNIRAIAFGWVISDERWAWVDVPLTSSKLSQPLSIKSIISIRSYVPSQYMEVVVNEVGPTVVNFTLTPSDNVEGIF